MSTKEYLEFTAAKSACLCEFIRTVNNVFVVNIRSFAIPDKRNRFISGKFKEWIGLDDITSLRFKQDVIDVIGHLAHETIRKVLLYFYLFILA